MYGYYDLALYLVGIYCFWKTHPNFLKCNSERQGLERRLRVVEKEAKAKAKEAEEEEKKRRKNNFPFELFVFSVQ